MTLTILKLTTFFYLFITVTLSYNYNFTQLNYQIESLSPDFMSNFLNTYTKDAVQSLTNKEKGQFLFLLSKIYLYNLTVNKSQNNQSHISVQNSKSNYLLAYYYLKQAAEMYQNADAYYYLAVLEYMKLTPGLTIKSNINKIIKKLKEKQIQEISSSLKIQIQNEQQINYLTQILQDISKDMQTHHLHNTEHNLFMASLQGQIPAQLSLANMFKNGIGTDANCSSALAYYLSVLKATKIQTFQFPSEYSDLDNFQKQLYAKRPVSLQKYGQNDISILMQTEIFGEQAFEEYESIAMKFLNGEDGFLIDQKKSYEMFYKIRQQSDVAKIMLGFMHMKGRGCEKDNDKARQYMQSANKHIVARQSILVMKYFNMGYKNKRKEALQKMQMQFTIYEIRNNASSNGQHKKINSSNLKTPMIKYLIGSLVLSDEIKGNRKTAIFLIDEAAKQGNSLALVQMGLIMLDGSDVHFNCEKSAEYFSKQALSYKIFQQRIQMAKLAIKNQNYFFAFIKYVQLMIVGYRNAFINALYLTQVYGQKMFNFNQLSWSVEQAQKSPLYNYLLQKQITINKISSHILQIFQPSQINIFKPKGAKKLTEIKNQQSDKLPSQIKQYTDYINMKITQIGIQKHEISILQYFKYKKTKDISILQTLANTAQNSDHIYQSRFLLGRYYQHTQIPNSVQETRLRRAQQQYYRSTKSKFLGDLIYMIEGGQILQIEKIFTSALWYGIGIILTAVYLYWKKGKVLEERLNEQIKMDEEQKKQQVLQEPKGEQNKNQLIYRGPKFSQQQEESLKNSLNVRQISNMMESEIKNQQEKQIQRKYIQNLLKSKSDDSNQPEIIEDQQQKAHTS